MSTERAESQSTVSRPPAAEDPFFANAYAIAFRLLGDRGRAEVVAAGVSEQVTAAGGLAEPDWMHRLVIETLERCEPLPTADSSGIRVALRRRLARATPDEQVAGSLVHLAGYPVEFAADVLGTDAAGAASLAGVIAPPPDVDYRSLGDPALVSGDSAGASSKGRSLHRPHWTTVAAVAAVAAFVLAATQCQGARPTLGEPIEGSLSVEAVVPVPVQAAPVDAGPPDS